MFHTNRTIIARENNSSILEESVIDPTIQRTRNMTATEIKAILVAAYPEKSKSIKRLKKTIGHSDPLDYVTLVDMIVDYWNSLYIWFHQDNLLNDDSKISFVPSIVASTWANGSETSSRT